MRWIRKQLLGSILVYLIVGFLTAVLYFGVLVISIEIFQFSSQLSIIFAYVLATLFHFLVNRQMTFCSKESRLIPQLFRYLWVLAINYLAILGVASLAVNRFGCSVYLGIVLSTGVTITFGYLASKFWIFRHKESSL